jgi:hypothetical protein
MLERKLRRWALLWKFRMSIVPSLHGHWRHLRCGDRQQWSAMWHEPLLLQRSVQQLHPKLELQHRQSLRKRPHVLHEWFFELREV